MSPLQPSNLWMREFMPFDPTESNMFNSNTHTGKYKLYIFVFIKFIFSGFALWAHSTPLLVIIFRLEPDSSPAG